MSYNYGDCFRIRIQFYFYFEEGNSKKSFLLMFFLFLENLRKKFNFRIFGIETFIIFLEI